MSTEHTPLPWDSEDNGCLYAQTKTGEYVRVLDTTPADGDERRFSDDEADANQEFVLLAVTHHDKLVQMLGSLLGCCELNMDDMEPETRDAVHEASCYLADHFGK